MRDKSREAFEAWLAEHDPRSFCPNAYWEHDYKWKAWQASRKQALADAAQACASVCTPNLNSFGDGYNQAALDCEKSIKELK